MKRGRGLDAPLEFESDRAENAGFFVNDTLQFMSRGRDFSTTQTMATKRYTDCFGISQHG